MIHEASDVDRCDVLGRLDLLSVVVQKQLHHLIVTLVRRPVQRGHVEERRLKVDQCAVLNQGLSALKSFFHDDGSILSLIESHEASVADEV